MSDMKSTGIIRRVDDLGRIVIPKEVRRQLKIREGDPMELYMDENTVIFKRYDPSQSVKATLATLKNAIRDEPDLKCGDALLEKLNEMSELLQLESEGVQ